MRPKLFILLLLIGLTVANNLTRAQVQSEDEITRGSFLSTRPSNPFGRTASNTVTHTKSKTGTKKGVSSGVKRPLATSPLTKSNFEANTIINGGGASSYNQIAIGLGYTIYLCAANGRSIRVDPSREFKAGDAIRITLEPNADGYLYIFYTENNGEPQMIFPDARLQGGNNAIRAHVPYEVPSSKDPDPNLRWFIFDDNPAIERLYIAITRKPLPHVPIGKELVNYCKSNPGDCPWQPPAEIWAQVKVNTSEPTIVSKSKAQGQAQSSIEKHSITRGLGLSKAAPSPSVICMSASPNSDVFVSVIDLIHR